MKTQVHTQDWMLSELILNDGFNKAELANFLETTPSNLDDVLSLDDDFDEAFETKLTELYEFRHMAVCHH